MLVKFFLEFFEYYIIYLLKKIGVRLRIFCGGVLEKVGKIRFPMDIVTAILLQYHLVEIFICGSYISFLAFLEFSVELSFNHSPYLFNYLFILLLVLVCVCV